MTTHSTSRATTPIDATWLELAALRDLLPPTIARRLVSTKPYSKHENANEPRPNSQASTETNSLPQDLLHLCVSGSSILFFFLFFLILLSHSPNASRNILDSSRPPLKHDAEGCSNCRTKQSTCWYKKSKPIILSDGSEAWGEEKLCNRMSLPKPLF
jgi:hypothetical protein